MLLRGWGEEGVEVFVATDRGPKDHINIRIHILVSRANKGIPEILSGLLGH